MKKNILVIFLVSFSMLGIRAQNLDIKTLCCQNVDYIDITKDMEAALRNIDSTTMLDLSMQSPKLTTVPLEVTQLVNLKYLNLSFNRISIIPSSFANLKKLECLDLSGNHYLQKLPLFLNQMPNLKVIMLQDLTWDSTTQEKIKKQFPKIILVFQ